jgi:hypothetical protein
MELRPNARREKGGKCNLEKLVIMRKMHKIKEMLA